jgi:hypothetical protein
MLTQPAIRISLRAREEVDEGKGGEEGDDREEEDDDSCGIDDTTPIGLDCDHPGNADDRYRPSILNTKRIRRVLHEAVYRVCIITWCFESEE